jgi:hypothetical protein
MQYTEWCERVLAALAQLHETTPNADLVGVPEQLLAGRLFGSAAEQSEFATSTRHKGLVDALEDLTELTLVEPRVDG